MPRQSQGFAKKPLILDVSEAKLSATSFEWRFYLGGLGWTGGETRGGGGDLLVVVEVEYDCSPTSIPTALALFPFLLVVSFGLNHLLIQCWAGNISIRSPWLLGVDLPSERASSLEGSWMHGASAPPACSFSTHRRCSSSRSLSKSLVLESYFITA